MLGLGALLDPLGDVWQGLDASLEFSYCRKGLQKLGPTTEGDQHISDDSKIHINICHLLTENSPLGRSVVRDPFVENSEILWNMCFVDFFLDLFFLLLVFFIEKYHETNH